ncbi:MAG: thermonuclease family protein, partial [Bacillota bacterium]
ASLAAFAAPSPAHLLATVVRVVDGDTLVVRLDGREETVRLIGADTPETVHPTVGLEPGGPEASAYTKALLPPGTRVSLELDVEQRDRYGRLLAYVYLADGRMINAELLRAGWAQLLTIPPNVRHVELAAAGGPRGRPGPVGRVATRRPRDRRGSDSER